jgi:adenylate cyclase
VWRALHPLVEAQVFVWRPHSNERVPPASKIVEIERHAVAGGVLVRESVAHGAFESAAFLASPFHAIHAGALFVRHRIAPDATTFPYPVLADLQRGGATDYVAIGLAFSAGRFGFAAVATGRPHGFTDAQVDEIVHSSSAMAACFDVHLGNHVARTLLDTYVGRLTGARVLAGQIKSGDVERLDAAIWFSDIRGFTTLSRATPPAQLIAWLNEYFAAICAPITDHGGEILKFIGDAVLAVFPVSNDGPAVACRAARAAAAQAHARLDALNARRAAAAQPPLRHGIALHIGEVQYGNIGAEERLDFTVIGPAVNLASRLEGLCGKLDRATILSSYVAAHASDGLVSLGTFDLKGIDIPIEVFGLDHELPTY